jgi:hypothetical protein
MKNSAQLINGSMALLLISGVGCAGPGLKNMFSRNETDGYKTLEELEAEDAKKEAAIADAESGGPRFASWLPFGKKASEETETVASTGSDDSADDKSVDEKSVAKRSMWKNPLRKQETVETDPFLTNDDSTDAVVAKSEKTKKPAPTQSESSAAAKDGKASKDVASAKSDSRKSDSKPIRTISANSETDSAEAEDDLLVQKFEQHFRKNTAEVIDEAQADADAAPLIVAGKQTKASGKEQPAKATRMESVTDDKLLEFEKLLADKKTSAAKEKNAQSKFADDLSDPVNSEDEFFAAMESETATVQQKASSTKKRAAKSLDSFDSLLEAETPDGGSVFETVAAKSLPTGARQSTSRRTAPVAEASDEFVEVQDSDTQKSDEVFLADASGVFGATSTSKSSQAKSRNSRTTTTTAGAWANRDDEASDFNWSQTPKNSSPAGAVARKALNSTVDQFASMFSAARSADAVPPAAPPETPDTSRRIVTRTASQSQQSVTRSGMPIQTVSAKRDLTTSLEKPAGLSDDSFFTNASTTAVSPAAPTPTVVAGSQNEVQTSGGSASPSRFKARNWLLLLGGIIVVALLFAPGRKKPIQVNQPAV